jgi:hypothetical protein
LGAYLTFLGALKLKPGRQEKREQIIEQVERHFPPSTKTYEFTTADGFVAFMQMTGENLHGHNNKIYRPKKGVSSIVRGNIIKALNIKNPVGVLGIFNADDYEESNADFDQQQTIDLDRYGPFRHSGMYGKCTLFRRLCVHSLNIPFLARHRSQDDDPF